MAVNKPAWLSMPVLNVKELSKIKLNKLSQVYDEFANTELDSISRLDSD